MARDDFHRRHIRTGVGAKTYSLVGKEVLFYILILNKIIFGLGLILVYKVLIVVFSLNKCFSIVLCFILK